MNERQILEAARELIKGKQYDAAYNLLKTIPRNEIAIKWMAQLESRVKPASPQGEPEPPAPDTPPTPKTQEKKKARSGVGFLLIVFGVLGGLVFIVGYINETLPLPYAAYEITGRCPATLWANEVDPIVSDFLDNRDSAYNAPRLSVGLYVVEMKSIRNQFASADYPKCLEEVRTNLDNGMRQTIEGFEAFDMELDDLAFAYLESAAASFKNSYDLIVGIDQLAFLDYRLQINRNRNN